MVGRFWAVSLGVLGVVCVGCQRQVAPVVNPSQDTTEKNDKSLRWIRPPSALVEPGTIVLRTSEKKDPQVRLRVLCDATSAVGPAVPLEIRPAAEKLEEYLDVGSVDGFELSAAERVFLTTNDAVIAVRENRTDDCRDRLKNHLDAPLAMVRLVLRAKTSGGDGSATVAFGAGFAESEAFVDLPSDGGRGLLDDSVQSEVSSVKAGDREKPPKGETKNETAEPAPR